MALVQQQQQQQHYSLPNANPGKPPISIPPTAHSPLPVSASTLPPPLPQSSLTNTKVLRHWQSQPTLRSKASIQLNQIHAQAQLPYHSPNIATTQSNKRTLHTSKNPITPNHPSSSAYHLPLTVRSSPSSSSSIAQVAAKTLSSSELNRTQHKLMLQRQSFLADDKHHLDYPANMKRLTKEIDRINREYRCVRHYEDPMVESFLRVTSHHLSFSSPHPYSPTYSTLSSSSGSSSISTSSLSSSGLMESTTTTITTNTNTTTNTTSTRNNKISPVSLPPQPPLLQRRASDFMLQRQDRRNSSTSVHSAIIERSHIHHHQQQHPSCHFFTRWFKPSLPPTKRRHSHFTC